ncbi:MAG: MlaE family ABC transporter permease [Alphaproteobacteria bacterium]
MDADTHPKIESAETFLPDFELSQTDRRLTFKAYGEWSLAHIGPMDKVLTKQLKSFDYDNVTYDFTDVTNMDTAGAYIFARAIRCDEDVCFPWDILGADPGKQTLMMAAANASMGRPPSQTRQWFDALSRLGIGTERAAVEALDTLAFLGKFMSVLLRLLLKPQKIRWKSVVALVEDIGLNAAPIVMFLSFFIGAVIAYMGANLLASIGVQVFMVDLVGYSMLRELAVVVTAILLAGRSASAFTAKLGAMRMRQEIDAMTVIGLDTFETLVVPRALACLISAPILTFLAMMSGVGGGMLVAWLGPTDISPILFFARMQEVIEVKHFWVGMVKSPVFAIIIAIIGCRQGLAVTGSVDSLGSRTTASVVQAIFTVIAVDAIFAMLFLEMGV